ncbi:MAG: type II toxin-antitoxin system PemK/MazF family toxin [Actinomycetota bacterium]|nr:type II toxin-antitoxin system PemK/MazF family toxin [Actinomycetota bacterium]
MRRGEVWLAHVGGKRRPVLVLTRSAVIDVRQLVTVVEVTTNIRGLGVEVELDLQGTGLDEPSVVNCDGIHTIEQRALTGPLGAVAEDTMSDVCSAIGYALGC